MEFIHLLKWFMTWFTECFWILNRIWILETIHGIDFWKWFLECFLHFPLYRLFWDSLQELFQSWLLAFTLIWLTFYFVSGRNEGQSFVHLLKTCMPWFLELFFENDSWNVFSDSLQDFIFETIYGFYSWHESWVCSIVYFSNYFGF